MKLSGNTLLVTGGTRGIGLAMASAFYQRKNKVLVCGTDERRLAFLRTLMPDLVTFRCDLGSAHEVENLASQIKEKHGTLNMLINNAGVQYNYKVGEPAVEPAWIKRELDINVQAPMQLCQQLLPVLKSQEEAAILNVTSALALVPKQSAPVYCASKAALRQFTQALRYQLESTSVKVFELAPALVDTDMTAGRGSDKISTDSLVEEALEAIADDRLEILIGKTRTLYLVHRLLPSVAARIIRYS